MQAWLTANAEDLGLLNRDGAPNQTAIEEISKVANWKPEGGATPTPTSELPALVEWSSPTQGVGRGPTERFTSDLDDELALLDSDEIPF